ncbi:16033_t:CDS:2, partial [Funneliformis geosporum]
AATIEIISLTTEHKINDLNATISLMVVNSFISGIGYTCSKFALRKTIPKNSADEFAKIIDE